MAKKRKCVDVHTFTFNTDDPNHTEHLEGPSMTEQGQSKSVKEIVEQAQKGLIVGGRHQAYYQSDTGEVDFDTIPAVVKMEDELTGTQEMINQLLERQKEQEEKIRQEKERIQEESLPPKPKPEETSEATEGGSEADDAPSD